ncbi:hypothetical protein KSP40_PGU010517 [Platanthera guangdongensis]|uniref:Uncharacterized protein n=1 Tax=Platanthera guangdongensis TaxID=2320717 RepID=A0ABR2ME66_9ASPA
MQKFLCGGCLKPEDDVNQNSAELQSTSTLISSESLQPNQVLSLIRMRGAFSTKSACFSPNGPAYDLAIYLEDPEQKYVDMMVVIDEEVVYEVKTRKRTEENVKLEVDGMTVNFSWDLTNSPAIFSFKTRGKNSEKWYWLKIVGYWLVVINSAPIGGD